jgi:23S rRNA pseudouridine1911/1915/1917 synthase
MGDAAEKLTEYSQRPDADLDDDEASGAAPDAAVVRLTVPDTAAGRRLDAVLAALLEHHSRTRLARWIDAGRVTVDGRPGVPRDRLHGGEHVVLRVEADPRDTSFAPEPMSLAIVHEDAHLIVLDKPAGLVVHPAAGHWSGTLLNGLLAHDPALAALPRGGIVHRLDKDTTGLMVVARTLEAQTALVRQLQARTVSRHYTAFVVGRAPRAQGTVDAPVGRHPHERTRMAVVPSGKPAVTHWTTIEHGAGWSAIDCRLETGRTHQIRVHLASIGLPLLGDPVYGAPRGVSPALGEALGNFARQALHARHLALLHPATGVEVAWDTPLPEDLAALHTRLHALGL